MDKLEIWTVIKDIRIRPDEYFALMRDKNIPERYEFRIVDRKMGEVWTGYYTKFTKVSIEMVLVFEKRKENITEPEELWQPLWDIYATVPIKINKENDITFRFENKNKQLYVDNGKSYVARFTKKNIQGDLDSLITEDYLMPVITRIEFKVTIERPE